MWLKEVTTEADLLCFPQSDDQMKCITSENNKVDICNRILDSVFKQNKETRSQNPFRNFFDTSFTQTLEENTPRQSISTDKFPVTALCGPHISEN